MYMFYRYYGFPNVTCTMSDVWPMAVTKEQGLLNIFGSLASAAEQGSSVHTSESNYKAGSYSKRSILSSAICSYFVPGIP